MSTHFCLDNSPTFELIELDTIDSTNNFLRFYQPRTPKEMVVATAEFQLSGKGQMGNFWESEAGKNLLLSICVHPHAIAAHEQFVLSQAIALAVKQALDDYADNIYIKWPNDIYAGHNKIAGILIENTLTGKRIDTCIIGIGVNVNQTRFHSDAPNPISLCNLTGTQVERIFILEQIIGNFSRLYKLADSGENGRVTLAESYHKALINYDGLYDYIDAQGSFRAILVGVEPDGHLILQDEDGHRRRYAFKEVKHVLQSGKDPSSVLTV